MQTSTDAIVLKTLGEIKFDLSKVNDKLDKLVTDSAVLKHRVNELEKSQDNQKKFISAALLSSLGTAASLIIKYIINGGVK